MKQRLNNKIIKNHAKKRFKGKRYILINNVFYKNIIFKLNYMPLKSKKWLFRRLVRRRLIFNYRVMFIRYVQYGMKNINYFDPFYKFFYRFNFVLLVSLNFYQLTDYHLELIRRLIRKLCGKRVFIRLLIKATFIIYKRVNQVRMGGGKGVKFNKKIYLIYPGCSLLEIRGISKKMNFSLNKKLKKKLSFDFKLNILNRC